MSFIRIFLGWKMQEQTSSFFNPDIITMQFNGKVLTKKIYNILEKSQSVILVAPTDAGKTWFVLNKLIPFLGQRGVSVKYFEDGDAISGDNFEIAIVDEVEILADRKFLEEIYPEDRPFYTDSYLKKMQRWHSSMSKLKMPSVYIVTRNDKRAIGYLKKKVFSAEWDGRKIEVLEFKR